MYYFRLPKNFTFGGALLLLHEVYNLKKSRKISLVVNCKKEKKPLFNVNKFFESNIKINFSRKKKSYYIDLNKIIEKKKDYSFIFLYKNIKKIKFIQFKKKYLNEVKKFLQKNDLKNYLTVHLKKDTTNIGSAKINEWKKFIKKISKNYKVILLNSAKYKNQLKNISNVYFINKGIKNIFYEPIIALLSKAFFANASGFCTFINFSNTSYLSIKNPKHHSEEFKFETKKNKLLFAKKNQFIIRNKQDNKLLLKYAKKIIR